jgi:protein-disulfide isomerase
VVKNARAKSSKRGFYAALAIVAVAGGAAIYAVAQQSREDRVERVAPVAAGEAKGQLLGDPNAPVQIVEFADFECPGCAQFAIVTEPDVRKRIVEAGLASFRFYDFPLDMHPNAVKAHMAAACAADQGKFWEMHDLIFAGQNDWNTRATRNPKGVLEGYARQLGLDGDKWEDCYDNNRHAAAIEANKQEGIRRQVGSTPTFFIGDRKVADVVPYDELKAYVDSARAAAGAATPAPAPATPAPGSGR